MASSFAMAFACLAKMEYQTPSPSAVMEIPRFAATLKVGEFRAVDVARTSATVDEEAGAEETKSPLRPEGTRR